MNMSSGGGPSPNRNTRPGKFLECQGVATPLCRFHDLEIVLRGYAAAMLPCGDRRVRLAEVQSELCHVRPNVGDVIHNRYGYASCVV